MRNTKGEKGLNNRKEEGGSAFRGDFASERFGIQEKEKFLNTPNIRNDRDDYSTIQLHKIRPFFPNRLIYPQALWY